MTNPTLVLRCTDFELLPEQPLRTSRFWLGKAAAVPLCLALALAYLLIPTE